MIEAEPTHGLDQAMDVETAHGQACNGKCTATGSRDWMDVRLRASPWRIANQA